MESAIVLGIDCGGTHTDAALLAIDAKRQKAELLYSAKVLTRHDALPETVHGLLSLLAKEAGSELKRIRRITLGTTLEVNSLIEDKADRVGLALSAGPGLNPEHFTIGPYYCIVPGGLDHRGVEVGSIDLKKLARDAGQWPGLGVKAIACVGKFSPRNPAHELAMAKVAREVTSLPVCMGHSLSGKLDFPRRIATAYYNAAIERLHAEFLDAMEKAVASVGLNVPCRLLKADGGAIPFSASRRQAVQSILSGPAASVMGVMATWPGASQNCSILFDMGGTTTDIALFYSGSPVLDKNGMFLLGRHTLIRSLASHSIGIGGDSLLQGKMTEEGPKIQVGPQRDGSAMAFGGERPTLLDAFNTLDRTEDGDRGDIGASVAGLELFTRNLGLEADQVRNMAELCVNVAMEKIREHTLELVRKINSQPIYTLEGLKSIPELRPEKACVVGGPAKCVRARLERCLDMPVTVGPHAEVANAIGAALVKPTASLEVYADTGRRQLLAPSLDISEKIPGNCTLEQVMERARQLLTEKLRQDGMEEASVEVVESDLFATLDDYGHGSRDMRVTVQARPGIIASLEKTGDQR